MNDWKWSTDPSILSVLVILSDPPEEVLNTPAAISKTEAGTTPPKARDDS